MAGPHFENGKNDDPIPLSDDERGRHQRMLDSLNVAIVEHNVEGRITFSNLAHAKIFDCLPQELIQKRFWELTNDTQEREKLHKRHAVLVHKQPSPVPLISQCHTKTGRPILIQLDWNYVRNDAGQLIGFVSVVKQISVPMADDENQQVQRFAELAGEIVIAINENEQVTYINRKGCEILEINEQQVVGLNWFDRFLSPAIRERVRSEFHGVLDGANSKPDHYESEFLTARGRVRTIAWHNLLQIEEPGTVVGTICVGVDVSGQREVETDLDRKRSQAQMILYANPDIFFHMTADGTIIDYECEDTERLLLNPHEFLNRRMQDVLDTECAKLFDEAVRLVRSTGESSTIEYPLQLPMGKTWFEARVMPFQNDDVVAIVRDITDRIRTEEQLRQNQDQLTHVTRLHMIGELATGFAHELNQPLGAILLYSSEGQLSLGSEEPPDLEQLRELFSRISRMAKLGGGIIHRLRRLAVRSQPKKSDLVVENLCRDVLNLLDFEMRKREIGIETHFAERPVTVKVDEIQVQQVLLNLIRNAMDAMEQNSSSGRVLKLFVIDHGEDKVELAISDNGTGIASDAKSSIFDAFFSTKEFGMGMGLTISRSIVESSGGQLWATANEDQGTTFHFTLPKHVEEIHRQALETDQSSEH